MTSAVPELFPMEDMLIKKQDMWKRGLRLILKMTSGVVYSIVMHILLITAHSLLIILTLYTRGFDLNLLFNVSGFFYLYLMFGLLGEIAVRASIEERVCVTAFGHVSHMAGCILLSAYKVPFNPIGAFAFFSLRVAFFFWCVFVSYSTFLPALLVDDSLTQPLV